MAEEVKVVHDLETGFYERGDGLLIEHLKTQDENLHSLIERYECKRMIIVSLTDPMDSDEDSPENEDGDVLFEFSERVEPDSNDDSVNGCDVYNAKIYAYKPYMTTKFWLSVGVGVSKIINIIKKSENNEETLIVFNSFDLSSTCGKKKKRKRVSSDDISTLFAIIANQVEMLYHEEKEEKKLQIIVTLESDGSVEYVDEFNTRLLNEIKKEKKNKKKNKKKDKKKNKK